MEAFGTVGRQQLYRGLEEYCRILAAQLPEAGEEAPLHSFPAGFFEELHQTLITTEK